MIRRWYSLAGNRAFRASSPFTGSLITKFDINFATSVSDGLKFKVSIIFARMQVVFVPRNVDGPGRHTDRAKWKV